MTNEKNDSFPENATDVFGDALERLGREWRPLLVAMVARMAAVRFRELAAITDGERHRRLFACAEREDDIIRTVEAVYRDAATIERELLDQSPDLVEIERTAFAGRPLPEQLLAQSRRAHVTAATWRALAQQEHDPARHRMLYTCVDLEELNALVLELTIRDAPI